MLFLAELLSCLVFVQKPNFQEKSQKISQSSYFTRRLTELEDKTERSDCYWWCGEWPASWEPQEEGMMNITASFSLSKKPRFNRPVGKSQTSEGDAC
jgi:hypothetical protein